MNQSLRRWTAVFSIFLHLSLVLNPVFAQTTAASTPEQGRCRLKSQVCVDGPGTKDINGVKVHRDCWEYSNTYECLDTNVQDACAPLKTPQMQCENTAKNCIKSGLDECLVYSSQYSCDQKLPAATPGITELPPSHQITDNWDESQCRSDERNCKIVATKCIEGAASKRINGVDVHRECWKEERTVQCATGQNQNECSALEKDKQCTLKTEQCSHSLPDGTCQISEKTFVCTESAATSKEISTCGDRDFAKTMTSLEMAREMQRFYDPAKQRFFNGEPNKCSIKLGGALDGVLGGDCCQTKAEPGKMRDGVIMAGSQIAIQNMISTVASHYTYTTLTGQAASYLGTALTAAGMTSTTATGAAAANAAGVSSGLGAFGFSVAPASSGGLVVGFDPVSFGITIAIMALQQYLKCAQPEILTAMKRKAGLCHYIGSYCGQKVLGACVKKMESQCCYVSKLAKLVNVGGKEQLKLGFGTPEAPQCDGFTAQELEQIDFSKLDLSEFYQEIYASMDNISRHMDKTKGDANTSIKSGGNPRVKNYYER